MIQFFVIQEYRLAKSDSEQYHTGPASLKGPYHSLEGARAEAIRALQESASRHKGEFDQTSLEQALAEIANGQSAQLQGKTITVDFEIQQKSMPDP